MKNVERIAVPLCMVVLMRRLALRDNALHILLCELCPSEEASWA